MKTFRFTILFVVAFVVGMFSVDAQTTIAPFVQVNGGSWQQGVSTAAINLGDVVNLSAWPEVATGYSWTGPGGFTSGSRTVDGVAYPAASNTYILTYIDPSGKQSVQPFTVTVNPTPFLPYIQVNGDAWLQAPNATVNVGDTVNLSGQNIGPNGSWSWGTLGVNTREAFNVPITTSSNLFAESYTNTSGVVSTQTFTITVNPTPILTWAQVNGGAWQQVSAISVNPGDVVNLATWPSVAPGWSWVGPGSYSASTREITSVPLTQGANIYTATYTNPDGAISHQSLTVTVLGYSVELSWSAPANQNDPVTGYHVYRATGSGAYALLGSAASTAYTDTTAANGLTYNYEVKSVDAAGVESVVSNVYTAVIP
jgi:hypothetical protein